MRSPFRRCQEGPLADSSSMHSGPGVRASCTPRISLDCRNAKQSDSRL